MKEILVVLTTVPDEEVGASIARIMVEEKLAACVNVVPGLRSIYVWKEEICDESECLLVAKVRKDDVEAYAERMQEIHPYETPEIVGLPGDYVSPSYATWCLEQTERG